MKTFEKHLTNLINMYKTNNGIIFSTDTGISNIDLQYLKAKNLISLKPYADNTFLVTITNEGFTYFDNIKSARADFWKKTIINFLFGVITGVIGTLLTTYFIGVLKS